MDGAYAPAKPGTQLIPRFRRAGRRASQEQCPRGVMLPPKASADTSSSFKYLKRQQSICSSDSKAEISPGKKIDRRQGWLGLKEDEGEARPWGPTALVKMLLGSQRSRGLWALSCDGPVHPLSRGCQSLVCEHVPWRPLGKTWPDPALVRSRCG